MSKQPKRIWKLPDDDTLVVLPMTSDTDPSLPGVVDLSLNAFGMNVISGIDFVSAKSQVYVLTEKGVVIGFVLFGQLNKTPEMTVHYLAVDPAQRRRGHGRHLLEHVRRRCIELEIP